MPAHNARHHRAVPKPDSHSFHTHFEEYRHQDGKTKYIEGNTFDYKQGDIITGKTMDGEEISLVIAAQTDKLPHICIVSSAANRNDWKSPVIISRLPLRYQHILPVFLPALLRSA